MAMHRSITARRVFKGQCESCGERSVYGAAELAMRLFG